MAEYVADDGSRCAGDFLLNRQRLLLLMIFSRVRPLWFVLPHGVIVVKIVK